MGKGRLGKRFRKLALRKTKNKQQANGIINARGISRLHARIIREEDTYYIEDLNSTNGTYLNEAPLEYHQKMELCKDDHIRFGGEEYVFY